MGYLQTSVGIIVVEGGCEWSDGVKGWILLKGELVLILRVTCLAQAGSVGTKSRGIGIGNHGILDWF